MKILPYALIAVSLMLGYTLSKHSNQEELVVHYDDAEYVATIPQIKIFTISTLGDTSSDEKIEETVNKWLADDSMEIKNISKSDVIRVSEGVIKIIYHYSVVPPLKKQTEK